MAQVPAGDAGGFQRGFGGVAGFIATHPSAEWGTGIWIYKVPDGICFPALAPIPGNRKVSLSGPSFNGGAGGAGFLAGVRVFHMETGAQHPAGPFIGPNRVKFSVNH